MLSRRTVIGLVVGSVIIGIGAVSLAMHLGTITIQEENYVKTGDSSFYTIPAPAGSAQRMQIEGAAFNVTASGPGIDVPETAHRDSAGLEWTHDADGETNVRIENTGAGELLVTGTVVRSSDPIWITYDLMVITSGVVIVGFSMGFTVRRPRGF